MKKNIGGFGDICNIYYYNIRRFDTAIIILRNFDELIYIFFNIFGEYDGYFYQNFKRIKRICYNDHYTELYKKIIDKSKINNLNLITKEDFIYYAFKNNKILGILNEDDLPYDDVEDVKVIDFDGVYIKYQKYERWAQLRKRIYKIKISKIVMLQVDSKYQRLLEKIRDE